MTITRRLTLLLILGVPMAVNTCMAYFRRLTLDRFVKTHPPSQQVSPAPRELVSAYEGILPASLLDLWSRKGLGFYGDLQLALIDPRLWQSVLDRWIDSTPDTVRRIPIALTPFGTLLYYRKLTETEEDVAYIDPVSKETSDLVWSLDDLFNKFLCERESLETLIPPALVQSARQECGTLFTGEVYEVDQMLLSMQMLRIAKVDAFDLHRRLRDAADLPKSTANKPATIADAVPLEYRSLFKDLKTGQDLCGLYLSSYLGSHRLLALRPNGQYQLLFWHIDDETFERSEIRSYNNTYEVSRSYEGDNIIELNIVLRAGSRGSDKNDERLVSMYTNGTTYLLQVYGLEEMATGIGGWGEMGPSKYYFRHVTLNDPFIEEPYEGRDAPPFTDLPHMLQALIHVEPLITTITHVADPNLEQEDKGLGTVMCTLDLGEDDGLRMNMPLYSPESTGRQLMGWVWVMAPRACKAGIMYQRGEDGAFEHGPRVGDVLTTRAPD